MMVLDDGIHSRDALRECRGSIPALKNKRYFNFGGQGTLPQPALDAIMAAYQYVQTNGPFSMHMFDWLADEFAKTRQMLATEFGGDANSYVLTQNTTEGCNIAAWGLDWQAGDSILLTDCEHHSLVEIAEVLNKRKGVKVEYVKVLGLGEKAILDAVEQALHKRVKLFAFSHVLWNTGAALPLKQIAELCRQHGVQTLIDGAQSIGAIPVNIAQYGIDYYAFTGHKWLCGPEGVGALFISPGRLEQLEPTFTGWRATEMMPRGHQGPHPARFEVATAPFPLLAGLRAAIEFHNRWGNIEQRFKRIQSNARVLRQLLTQTGRQFEPISSGQPQSGLVTFNAHVKNPVELVRKCEELGHFLRPIPEPKSIRASLHYFTDPHEIEEFVRSLLEQQALEQQAR